MQEHTNDNNCECQNGYETKDVFMENYGSDESINKCGNCPCASYENGIMICTKFS